MGAWTRDPDNEIPCETPGCTRVAYSLATPHVFPPCPHGRALCGEHNLDGCWDCRLLAEASMT